MNAFEQLSTNFKKQFDKVYKANSYQMFYSEAEILLDVVENKYVVYHNKGDYVYFNRFKEILGI